MNKLIAIVLSLSILPANAQPSDEDRIRFHMAIARIHTFCALVNEGFLTSSDGKQFIGFAVDAMMANGNYEPEVKDRLKSLMIEDYRCPKDLLWK